MKKIRIALNPHWYSKFWIRQFYDLWRQGKIALRPLLTQKSPAMCFRFDVDGHRCLIDVSDHKMPRENPADYSMYFKANYSPTERYSDNVRPCVNGTTLTRHNQFQLLTADYTYDLVWITGIGGGRPHKVALFEALASLPLKTKLVARMISQDDFDQWGEPLRRAGVELWEENVPYRKWLELSKQGRWCMLGRGKHDCLSFKMIDYCSIGAAVVADYPPTSVWDVPIKKDVNYLSFDVSGPLHNDIAPAEFEELRREYYGKVHGLLPQLQDEVVRQNIAVNNAHFFTEHIRDGRAAARVLRVVTEQLRLT